MRQRTPAISGQDGNNAAIVCEVACDRLVGVDRYSNSPASVRALPQVGGGLDPNVEAIVALRPDVVLLSQAARATQRLEALGVKVIALEPRTGADVRRVLDTLGTVLGVAVALLLGGGGAAGVSAGTTWALRLLLAGVIVGVVLGAAS